MSGYPIACYKCGCYNGEWILDTDLVLLIVKLRCECCNSIVQEIENGVFSPLFLVTARGQRQFDNAYEYTKHLGYDLL